MNAVSAWPMVASIALITLISGPIAGCRKAEEPLPTGPGIHIRDDLGRHVHLDKPALRVVSLSPGLTEALFAVGCGERLVLRDAWSDHPRGAIGVPTIKGLKPSPEAIIDARPDLVLASFPAGPLVAGLEAADVPLLALSPNTFEQVATGIERVGKACGKDELAAELAADFRAEMRAVQTAVHGRRKPRVFLEIDAGTDGRPYTLGKGAFGHELIELAGGDNVFAHGTKSWFAVGLESILAADPEVMLLADASARGGQTAEKVAARKGWSAVRAVAKGQVHVVHADWVSRPGPRLVLGLRQVALQLHPQAFGLPAPKKQAR